MFRPKSTLLLALATLVLGACTQTPGPQYSACAPSPPPYFVPTVAIVQNQRAPAYLPTLANNILPSSDGFLEIPRGQREAWGNTPLFEYSAYSIYTFDAQPIGIRHHGYGYRYRYLSESGLFAPPPTP